MRDSAAEFAEVAFDGQPPDREVLGRTWRAGQRSGAFEVDEGNADTRAPGYAVVHDAT